MAAPSPSIFLHYLLPCCLTFFLALGTFTMADVIRESQALGGGHHGTVRVSSLLPVSVCESSAQGVGQRGTLKVMHRYGPCSHIRRNIGTDPTPEEILTRDQSRVKSIHARIALDSANQNILGSKATIPAKSGRTVGSGNYVVSVGLGTPMKSLTLIFDTGSSLTWTQCQPCARSCYSQVDPLFSPSLSASYSNVSCSAAQCMALTDATGNQPGCSSATCVYGIQYGDQSFSVGFFAKDTLTLTPKDVVKDFFFGCGENNQGRFGGSAGLIGLGPHSISIVSQTAGTYGRVFSYCLPSRTSLTGYLNFGAKGVKSNVQYTPLTNALGNSYYSVDVTAVYVAGMQLPISPSVFSSSGTIVDSGTVITRLPPTAYSALRSAFRSQMSKYPLTQSVSILDTCYDFSNYTIITVPVISFVFGGGVKVDINAIGGLYVNSISQVCLAFAGNGADSDPAIYGNTQQKTFSVVYNSAARKIGFGVAGCA